MSAKKTYIADENIKVKHDETIIEKIKKETKAVSHTYNICGCGSTVFQKNNSEHPVVCRREKNKKRVCTAPTEAEAIAQGRIVTYKSVGDLIARQLADKNTRQLMQYRHSYEHREGEWEDVFDGRNYQTMLASNDFSENDDVAIGLFIDGFVPSKSGRKSNLTLVLLINFNIPPEYR